MKIAITGHSSGIGSSLESILSLTTNYEIRGYSKSNGWNIAQDDGELIIQELIRGIINDTMYGEVPYESAVVVDVLENKEKLIRIKSTIIVNNTNQKKILIGTSGQNIKKIGIESRLLIEKIYFKDVYIDLIVEVNENWKNDIQILKKIGFAS